MRVETNTGQKVVDAQISTYLRLGVPRVNAYWAHEFPNGDRQRDAVYRASAQQSWTVMTRGKQITVKS